MHRAAFGFLLVVMSTVAYGGYDEFAILDFRMCKAYQLTSEWGEADFPSIEAKRQFEREREIAGLGPDRPVYAMLTRARS